MPPDEKRTVRKIVPHPDRDSRGYSSEGGDAEPIGPAPHPSSRQLLPYEVHDATAFGRVAVSLESHSKEVHMPSVVKPITLAQYQALITGIPNYCATTTFSVASQTFTAPQAVALIQTVINASAAVNAARAAWRAALLAQEKVITGDAKVANEIRESVALMFSNAPTTLSALAIVPRKLPKPLTGAARAAATAKADATRKARGTTSKQQKALISGNVTGVTITPVTTALGSAPAATAPIAPSPASPTTSGGVAAAPAAPVTHS
jgi:hypothetical protein